MFNKYYHISKTIITVSRNFISFYFIFILFGLGPYPEVVRAYWILCPGITLGIAKESICSAGDGTQTSQMQDKILTQCTISLANYIF